MASHPVLYTAVALSAMVAVVGIPDTAAFAQKAVASAGSVVGIGIGSVDDAVAGFRQGKAAAEKK